MKQCSIEGCTNKWKCRDWCSTHYKQWLKHGRITILKATHHDLSKTTEYKSWGQMKSRCLNPHHHAYDRYGGRGIKVCERWMSFENFYKDMGDKPHPSYSIERKDVNGDYEPSNCVWASELEQACNRRNSHDTPGVSQVSPNRWRAMMTIRGVRILDHYYGSYEEAREARTLAKFKYESGQQTLFIA